MASFHDFTVQTIDGASKALGDFAGQPVLVVNVASQCGFTRQYSGLEQLHQRFADRGFSVLGFPCNQFGAQEPGSNEEIKQFCTTRFSVTFPMFAKLDVKGKERSEVFQFLTDQDAPPKGKGDVNWNFEKFLVDGDGQVVGRFSSKTKPDATELLRRLEALL